MDEIYGGKFIKQLPYEDFPFMDKNTWGPIYWHYFHTLALLYSDHPSPREAIDIRILFWRALMFIPCSTCQEHAMNYVRKHKGPAFNDSKDFQLWLFNFHNTVNKFLKKHIFTKDDYYKTYGVII